MVDGTRFRIIDDNIKALQESQKQSLQSQSELQSEVTSIATALEDKKQIMNKVLVHLDAFTPKHKNKTDDNGSTSSGLDGPSWDHHLQHMRLVFQLLVANQLVAKLSKCLFGQQKAVLDHCLRQHTNQEIHQYLIHWEGLSEKEATWEDKDSLLQSFPNLHLEDKVLFKAGRNVVNEREPWTKEVRPRRSGRIKRVPAKLQD
ncbi:hypothetical protein E3N88_42349 [Mikania micrantha]|uniref:Chromo domain-containing protein n=1 Tax=Mikania micrantha TaxID=192012 RepID=A0A5N6LI02_9ASTR|nr:hypothetical protein E3N88_42349 [Mikania micrantha]